LLASIRFNGKTESIFSTWRFSYKELIENTNYKVIDWGFVDLGDPYYDLSIIDYYFKDNDDRENFYKSYSANKYDKTLIEYYDKLSKFINV